MQLLDSYVYENVLESNTDNHNFINTAQFSQLINTEAQYESNTSVKLSHSHFFIVGN